jgi:hypothetical protein
MARKKNSTPDNEPDTTAAAPGPVPIGEAMRLAVKNLGDVVVDDSLASQQLRELAGCYEHVIAMQAAWTERTAAAKTAKDSLAAATEVLMEKVREYTHPASLPLFDGVRDEADRSAMINGVNGDGGDTQPAA